MTFTPLRLALLCTVVCAAALSAQQVPPAQEGTEPSRPTFRVEANFIEVDAFVSDAAGNPVGDLRVDDFELYEGGERQEIRSFAAVDMPIERLERPLFAARPFEPDVQSNDTSEGRIYLILLDDVHVHPSRVPRVRAALRQFIERDFGTNDLAAVVRVRTGTRDQQDFTNNPRLLLQAIDRFTGNVPRDGDFGFAGGLAEGTASAVELQEAHDARDAMSRVRALSEFLAGVRGRRKAMLFISEGSPFDVYASVGQLGGVAASVREDMDKATAAAARGNVTIYPIDPRGLFAVDPNDLSGAEAPATGGVRLSQDYLRALADDTGGFAAINRNDFTSAFERIVRENSAYYLLGYSPANDARDGRFRRIEVRVTRPGLQVRSRSGYVAPTGRPAVARATEGVLQPAVRDALGSPLPTGGVPMTVFAAPYRGTGSTARVALAIDVPASGLALAQRDGAFRDRLEVVHTATSAQGRTFPMIRHEVALALRPDTFDRVTAHGLRVLSEMDLPPGRHQLRVAVGNDAGAAGGVIYDLEVPDFTRPALVMSGLSVTASSASRAVTIVPQPPLRVQLPTPIVTARAFDPDDTLLVYGEVYENGRLAPSRTLDITTELRTDTGRVVRRVTETRSSRELDGTSGGYGFTSDLPLDGLEPGIYVIHVDAQSNAGDRPVVSRDIQIRVKREEE